MIPSAKAGREEDLRAHDSAVPDELTYFHEWPRVAMMFSDLVGFTTMLARIDPREVLLTLHALFSRLDKESDRLQCWKYETVGDAYITASNLIGNDPGVSGRVWASCRRRCR